MNSQIMCSSSNIWLQFMLIIAQNKHQINCLVDYHCAINHIETYIQSIIGSIVYLSDTRDSTKIENTLYENSLRFARSSRSFIIINRGMIKTINLTKILHPFQSTEYSTVVIFHEFMDLQNIFSSVDITHLTNIKWLAILSGSYTSQLDVRKALLDSSLVMKNYFSSFQIKAQVYVVADVGKIHRMYEMYQVCEKRDYIFAKSPSNQWMIIWTVRVLISFGIVERIYKIVL